MKILGLTGGIGMGKSTVARMLCEQGCAVIDTDLLARQLVEPRSPTLAEIIEVFGPDLCDGAGRLRRAEMARLVFSDVAARRRLEGILHPRIRQLWQQQVADWRMAGREAAVVVIPLLFETGAAGEFDAVVCVACTLASQRQRCLARGWTSEQIEARLDAQWPIAQKIARSNYLVWSEGCLDTTLEQVRRILRQLNLHSLSASVRIETEKLVS